MIRVVALTLAALTSLVVPVSAHASVERKRPQMSVSTSTEELNVPVPHTDLDLGSVSSVSEARWSAASAPSWHAPARLELSTTSWVPNSLSMESRVPDTTAFRGSGIPEFSLSFLSAPVTRYRNVSLSLLAGVSFMRLKRNGTVGFPLAASQDEDELIFVMPLNVGAEVGFELTRSWAAYTSAALCPTLAATTRSVFDDGRTLFGIPLELEAGLSSDLRWMSSSFRGVQFKVGALATVGKFTDSDFSGQGVRAGLSFPM